MWITRQVESRLKSSAETRPVVVITGPRQTGKTSLVKRLFPEHSYVSLDLPSEAAQAEGNPSGFFQRHGDQVIIDEIQYAPSLFRHIKTIVDADRDKMGRFILTGSQPFPLMQGVSESLAGRTEIIQLPGLSLNELKDASIEISIEAFMLRGGFPELYERPHLDPTSFYASYVATYLERDLRQLRDIGNLRDFERFLRACALRTSQLVNRAELARDVGISESAGRQWLSVLEQSGIISLLEPWFSNATKSLIKTPKLHFNDSGLAAFLMGITQEADLEISPLTGSLWETTVFAEIRKELSIQGGWQLAFWRDRSKEADFLLHKAGRFKIADAKWSENPTSVGKLARIQKEIDSALSPTLFCRAKHPFPLKNGGEALPLPSLSTFLNT